MPAAVKQELAAIRMLFDWLVVGQVVPMNPAAAVRGPKHIVRKGKTPILSPEEARQLLDSIDTSTIVGLRDRAIIATELYTFGRVTATASLKVEDCYVQDRRLWLVSWNPNEGVLFLKNKQIDFVDSNPNDGGGIRVVYPSLGEELVLQVPLEVQTLPFEDMNVLTREYIPLTVRGTMYWKIVDLQRFYLLVSKEIDKVSDREWNGMRELDTVERSPKRRQYESAKHWLQYMAEEKTRTIIA